MVIKRCKNCLIPENYPNIKINDDGICNYCREIKLVAVDNYNVKEIQAMKIELKKEFENFIKKWKGRKEYDCLLLLSGGKDSAYLLYFLKEKYGLNVLALTVDTGLENPKIKLNIKKIITKLNVDHMYFRPKSTFFKKLYRYFITHPKSTYCNTVCSICQLAIISIGLNMALKRKIPFVALAYSPDQTPSFELSQDYLQNWIPKELYTEPFNGEDRSYFWNLNNVKIENPPRLFLPFYFLEYPGVEKIIKKLSELGLGTKRKFNPLKTNCSLGWLLIFLDYRITGYNPYAGNIADLIRQGKTSRYKWFLIFKFGTFLLKSGITKRRTIRNTQEYLDLKNEDLYSNANYSLRRKNRRFI